ncbi:ParA family protein [Candidatus Bathyarchaeota archaeon]|nr:ParA family protein [Candidatus Bathyarchaeota archaeon]
MPFKKTLAFHSYKGGTGKTTLIANLAALYAMKGMNVCLLDFDLYAPSLGMYFRKKPNIYLNALLRGDLDRPGGKLDSSSLIIDMSSELNLKGKFLLGLSSTNKEDIGEIEFQHDQKWQLKAIKRFQAFKNQLFAEHEIDCLLLDTSPGIRYWSINALAMANMLFLIMKTSDMDIEGTKKMANDIYDVLVRYGKSKYFLVLNKVPDISNSNGLYGDLTELTWSGELQKDIGTEVVGAVPCCCDVQFSKHEFLYAIKNPEHPFSKKVFELSERIENLC